MYQDIKPNNILVDYNDRSGSLLVKSVQIPDLEDSVLLPPGKSLKGCLCGNELGEVQNHGPGPFRILHPTYSPLELWSVSLHCIHGIH
jgi:hypothetical protein